VTRGSDGSLLIDAAMPMSEMRDLHDFRKLPDGDFVTLAGFVLAQLGHVPEAGDQFVWDGWRFRVVEMEDGGSTRCWWSPHEARRKGGSYAENRYGR
jgi:CBS domain containing-hemolysin-like protein